MLRKRLSSLIVVGIVVSTGLVLGTKSEAKVARLSSIYFNEGEVAKLFLTPGRSSLLLFPCNLVGFLKGPGGDYEASSKDEDPRELNIWLKSSAAEPTNLIVRCATKVFVFDVIPSQTIHQDFIKILGSFGSPDAGDSFKKVILSSESFSQKKPKETSVRPKVLRVISSSKGGSQ